MKTARWRTGGATIALLSAMFHWDAAAQTRAGCSSGTIPASVIAVDGSVSVTGTDGRALSLATGDALCPGDRITTGEASGIDIRFDGKDTVTNILSNSIVVIPESEAVDLSLQSGLMRFLSSVRSVFTIRTPHTDAGIDGTEALLAVTGAGQDSLVLIREGIVTATDRTDRAPALRLSADQASYASSSTALTRATPENVPPAFRAFVANPKGAADWAIYYPPILLTSGMSDPALLRAARLLDAGEPDAAEALLAGYAGPDTAAALALRSVTAVFRNRISEGLLLAREALAADPNAVPARIAESYALQASGMVDAARDAALRATQAGSGDAYAFARLAELELTLGNRRAARTAAEQSLALQPTALGHAVRGFALLATRDTDAADEAFRAAIALDAESPLPRLGLGLAAINNGDLAPGRREIETAASLDPQRAQLRTWLGRAYLEEGLDAKAQAQFTLAQEQDPDDPTPWIFAAETFFLQNRPLQAVTAIEKAQARADGRSTVRGRDGLGEDAATQATVLGRVYDVIGFTDQATQSAARAVAADPKNPGAHRFLADVYRPRPGFEIAQSSERLMADLLTGPTSDPIQLRLDEADLSLLDTSGATRVTFHEFSPVFDQDGIKVAASGALGSQQTFSDEVSLTIKDGNFSIGAAQYHSQTDGFFTNNGVTYDIAALQFRAEPVPGVSLFAEMKTRQSEQGDRRVTLGGALDPSLRQTEDRDTARIGAHIELTPNLDLLTVATLAQVDRLQTTNTPPAFPALTQISSQQRSSSGGDLQAQLIGDFGPFGLRAGASYLTLSTEGQTTLDSTLAGFLFPFGCPPGTVPAGANCRVLLNTPINERVRHQNAYAYGTYAPIDEIDLTLGLSYDRLETEAFTQSSVNPKVGIVAKPIDGVVLRAAYAQTIKRPFILDQVLEPTTLAGFNQFFDDENGAKAQLFAAGFDIKPRAGTWFGGEVVYRELDTPTPGLAPGTSVNNDGKEWRFRGYLNTKLFDEVGLAVGLEHSRIKSDLVFRTDKLTTTQVPVTLSYFHSSGAFGSLGGTWYRQEALESRPGAAPVSSDNGFIVDAAIGYRLPNKRGVLSLEVQNLFDSNVRFQDETSFSSRPLGVSLARERVIMGRFSVAF